MPTPYINLRKKTLGFAEPAAGIRVAQDIETDLVEVVVPVAGKTFGERLGRRNMPNIKRNTARNRKVGAKPHRIRSISKKYILITVPINPWSLVDYRVVHKDTASGLSDWILIASATNVLQKSYFARISGRGVTKKHVLYRVHCTY